MNQKMRKVFPWRCHGAEVRVILCTPGVIGEKVHGENPQDQMLDEYAEVSR